MQYDLSFFIPARNEEFLALTVQSILKNKTAKSEIIVGLDGKWSDPEFLQHPDVTVVYYPESIGQRAMCNRLCALSNAKYVCKLDAHCDIAPGLDAKMLEAFKKTGDDVIVVPVMRNLHVFDWVCKKCGCRRYQGPTPKLCPECDNTTEFEKDIVWIAKPSPQSVSYCFDSEPHFQYFKEYTKRSKYKKDLKENGLTETMSLQGSCFMMTKDKYFSLDINDESFGSWGSQGLLAAAKMHLSGGKVLVNHNTYYAHLFRTQGGDFSFPYPQSGKAVQKAKKNAKDLLFNNQWPQQKYSLSWLVKKFWPVQGWTDKDLKEQQEREKNHPRFGMQNNNKEIIYYTCNTCPVKIAKKCQRQLQKAGLPIISVSLKPMPHFGKNIHLPLKRGYLTMFRQILAGLEASNAEIIFFCEHDVLYHPSHFDFVPPKKDVYYYNLNVWKMRYEDGHALRVDDCKQTSGLCAYRELLVEHYRKRIAKILRNQADLIEKGAPVKNDGFSRYMGFEPGNHAYPRGVDDYKTGSWQSEKPIIDIRHENNLTPSRWEKRKFKNQKYTEGWTETKEIPGWESFKI